MTLCSCTSEFPRFLNIDRDVDYFLSDIMDMVPHFSPYSNDLIQPWFFGRRPKRHYDWDPRYIVSINVGPHYEMKDILIKIEGRTLEVKGDSVESLKHGSDAHSFHRKYDLPDDVIVETMKPHLTHNGVLQIIFDRKQIEPVKEIEDLSTENEFKVKVFLRGFKPEETSVKLVGRNLVIDASKKSESVEQGRETSVSGYASRTIRLGDEVDLDQIKVQSQGSFLEITAKKDPLKVKPPERKLTIEPSKK